jgi:hypothetical protein
MDNPNTQKALEIAKATSSKVADFTKSSVAKINTYPEASTKKMIAQKIEDAKDNPKTIGTSLKEGLAGAGKGAIAAGLAITSLPLLAAAIAANRIVSVQDKRRATEEIEHELIRIDQRIAKADSENDYDAKADLLIAKRETQKAFAKLKWGIKKHVNVASPESRQ